MHFRQIANPQMKMARLKSGDLQPLCKMPSPSSFFSWKFCFAALFSARPIDPAPNSPPSSPVHQFPRQQPRSTDRELRSSSFPFAVPIAVPIFRSVSSRSRRLLAISSSSYRFAPWLRYRSPSGPVPHQFSVAAISSSSRQVAAISQAVAACEQPNPMIQSPSRQQHYPIP
ncbi:hypothetical protein BDA96_01G060300 [Sorghum bicolor]|uniref:Uncharacterized protein n=1 Tax=Sorghum bicolor TaxID=4558 RepID=A0A921UWQ0_SORBI|nr:hypothetical protein BDA96_01G060300 [Sorghum bicolor]